MTPAAAPVYGPWRVRRGYRRSAFVAVRSVGTSFEQYLGADGRAKHMPSYFRSEAAAQAAIARAGKAEEEVGAARTHLPSEAAPADGAK